MKRRSVHTARIELRAIMKYCSETGDHKPFYEALQAYELDPEDERYTNAVAAFLEFCRRQQSP